MRTNKISDPNISERLSVNICVSSCQRNKNCERKYKKIAGFVERIIEDVQFIPADSDMFEYKGGLVQQPDFYKTLYLLCKNEMLKKD